MSPPNSSDRLDSDLDLILEFLRDEPGYFKRLESLLSNISIHGVAELFRLAHTIKGIAVSLGLDGVGAAAHEFETQLSKNDSHNGFQAIRSAGERLLATVVDVAKTYQSQAGTRSEVTASSAFAVELVGRDGLFSLPSARVRRVLFRPVWMTVPNSSAVLFEGRVLPVSTQYADPADWVVVLEDSAGLSAVAVKDVQCVKSGLAK